MFSIQCSDFGVRRPKRNDNRRSNQIRSAGFPAHSNARNQDSVTVQNAERLSVAASLSFAWALNFEKRSSYLWPDLQGGDPSRGVFIRKCVRTPINIGFYDFRSVSWSVSKRKPIRKPIGGRVSSVGWRKMARRKRRRFFFAKAELGDFKAGFRLPSRLPTCYDLRRHSWDSRIHYLAT